MGKPDFWENSGRIEMPEYLIPATLYSKSLWTKETCSSMSLLTGPKDVNNPFLIRTAEDIILSKRPQIKQIFQRIHDLRVICNSIASYHPIFSRKKACFGFFSQKGKWTRYAIKRNPLKMYQTTAPDHYFDLKRPQQKLNIAFSKNSEKRDWRPW